MKDALNQIRIVLCSTSHPGNIGSVARSMRTMGLKKLYLVNPKILPNNESYTFSSGAHEILDNVQICNNLPEAILDVNFVIGTTNRSRKIAGDLISAEKMANSLKNILKKKNNVAIVFGSEKNGLTNKEIAKCNVLSYIQTSDQYGSLNIAQAVQVFSYEIFKTFNTNTNLIFKEKKFAENLKLEFIEKEIWRIMDLINFSDEKNLKVLKSKIRKIINKSSLESDEANIVIGILKAILLKLK